MYFDDENIIEATDPPIINTSPLVILVIVPVFGPHTLDISLLIKGIEIEPQGFLHTYYLIPTSTWVVWVNKYHNYWIIIDQFRFNSSINQFLL